MRYRLLYRIQFKEGFNFDTIDNHWSEEDIVKRDVYRAYVAEQLENVYNGTRLRGDRSDEEVPVGFLVYSFETEEAAMNFWENCMGDFNAPQIRNYQMVLRKNMLNIERYTVRLEEMDDDGNRVRIIKVLKNIEF